MFFLFGCFLIVSHCSSISDLVMELLSDQDRGAHTFEHSLAYCHDVLMY
jgi:phosphohistidine phosphatase SixA